MNIRKKRPTQQSERAMSDLTCAASVAVDSGRCPNDGARLLRFAEDGSRGCPDCPFTISVAGPAKSEPVMPFRRLGHKKYGAPPKVGMW